MLVNIQVGYTFNEAECRYYYTSNGKPVSERRLESMVKKMRSHYERQANNLAREAMEGVLSQEVFVDAMRSTMKSAAINFAALGVGGHSRLTFTEYGRVGGYLASDYRRLNTFADVLYANELSFDQAQVRSALYIGHQQDNFYKSRCIPQAEEGFTFIEKRTLGNRVKHCVDCIGYHQRLDLDGIIAPSRHRFSLRVSLWMHHRAKKNTDTRVKSMANNAKIALVVLAKQLASNSGNPKIVNELRRIELEERRALKMRITQIEKNWDIKSS